MRVKVGNNQSEDRRELEIVAGGGVTATLTDTAGEVAKVTLGATGGAGGVVTDTIFDAKGDIPVGTGADTATKVTVGADDTAFIADSAQPNGVKWVKIGNAQVAVGAAIAYSKLALTASVLEADLSLADNTTGDATTGRHGFLKKLDNNANHFMDGTGAWTTPPGVGGAYPTEARIRYVCGTGVGLTGSDSNDGLTPSSAFATIQAAYDSLPAQSGSNQGGGTIFLLPGLHDIGTGFLGNGAAKHAVIQSITGFRPDLHAVARGGTLPLPYPTVYTSANATSLFKIGLNNGSNQTGWVFRGIAFDMSVAATTTGIRLADVLYPVVENCAFEGGGTVSERYAVRTGLDGGSDCSYGNIRNNWCNEVGIAALGDFGGGNCNGWNVHSNVKFLGESAWGIKATNMQRSWIGPNNIEMGTGGKGAILLTASYFNTVWHNRGEGLAAPWVRLVGGSDNVLLNNGSSTGGYAESDIYDDDTGVNIYIEKQDARHSTKTANYVLVWTDHGKTINMDVAGANTLTIPPQSSVKWRQGAKIWVRQVGAGQTTITEGAGVVIRSVGGAKKTNGQYFMGLLQRVNTDEWQLFGSFTT